ncbi:helix-turn-helix domain-containing protein [Lewinella sp. LCG006]|uniref:helix-turn-helix domain-containing protein n=1 Tax=Lewinella sp. LCG006 TaxID=3231911 RepID=UPI003460650E
MAKRNTFFRETLTTIPEDTKIFVRRQIELLKRIRYLMEIQHLTQKDLATKMEKRESEISKWLSGGHNLTWKSLAKLEAALGAPIIEIPKVPTPKKEGWRKVGGINHFTVAVQRASEISDEAEFTEAAIEKAPSLNVKNAVA